MFWEGDPAKLQGKQRQAFRAGFLGLSTFGWSTLVSVSEAGTADEQAAVTQLTGYLLREHGAPDQAAAEAAAREELAFAASLCDHPVGTLIALQRSVDGEGEVRERFRTLKPAPQTRAQFDQPWVRPITMVAEEEPSIDEAVDLMDLAQTDRPDKGRT
jgi:hypothetical protein